MINKQTRFSLRKGRKNDLPTHALLGEPLFCLDTGEIYRNEWKRPCKEI